MIKKKRKKNNNKKEHTEISKGNFCQIWLAFYV